ncbi:hypothetical protein ABZP36_011108 [Zizania latifolia]
MAAKVAFLLAAAMLLGLVSNSHAIEGTATFYTTYNRFCQYFAKFAAAAAWTDTASACYGNQDNGKMIAAVSDELWAGDKICGKMFTVRCVRGTNAVPNPCHSGTITVKIVDHCPGCNGTLDLSKEAFATIGNPVAGKIVIDYHQA